MRIGSLFSGIGGLELGLEWAGVGHTVWQVEQDEWCRNILAKHWPTAERFVDVRDVGKHNLAPVDVICGGFPCTDISYANTNGRGLDGERSGLWYEYARIIGEMAPRYAVVENVPALFTRGFGDVLGSLSDIGYDAEWDVVSAASVGAPHKRDRVFIIAFPCADGVRNSIGGGRSWESRRRSGEVAANGHSQLEAGPHSVDDTECAGLERYPWDGDDSEGRTKQDRPTSTRGIRGGAGSNWWTTEPSVGRVAYGVSERVDKLRALGNAVVPQVAEVVGRRLLAIDRELRMAVEGVR